MNDWILTAVLLLSSGLMFLGLRELRRGAETNLVAWEHARWLHDRLADSLQTDTEQPNENKRG